MHCTALLNGEVVYAELTQADIYAAGHRDASGAWIFPTVLVFSETDGQVFMHETTVDTLVDIQPE